MTNESDAISEVAKTTGKALGVVEKVGSAINRYFGGAFHQIGGIFEDTLAEYRWRRAVRLFDQADLFLAERELNGSTRPVPAKLLLPIVREASLEEDDELQDIWAALLANAADPHCSAEMRHAFVTILKDLSPLDARNLALIYSPHEAVQIEQAVYTTLLPHRITEHQEGPDRPTPDIETSLSNLGRLGLITTGMAWAGYSIYNCVHRTSLGVEFVKAVSKSRRAA